MAFLRKEGRRIRRRRKRKRKKEEEEKKNNPLHDIFLADCAHLNGFKQMVFALHWPMF